MIIILWKEGKQGVYKSTGKSFRKAYMPFLTKLTTLLLDQQKKSPEIEEAIKAEPAWETYLNTEYKPTYTVENKPLVQGPEKEPDPFGSEEPIEKTEEKEQNPIEEENKEPTEKYIFFNEMHVK